MVPTFICVGAARSGTTSLWAWLDAHPQVCMSPIKETNYFAWDLIHRNGPGDLFSIPKITQQSDLNFKNTHAALVANYGVYQALFNQRDKKIYGEISPSYLYYSQHTAARIHKCLSECKILIILREPVSRAISQYELFRKFKRETMPLNIALLKEEERIRNGWEYAWAYRKLGYYYKSVKNYLDVFGRKNTWIGLYEDLSNNPNLFFLNICKFLGIHELEINPNKRINESNFSRGFMSNLAKTRIGREIKKSIPLTMQRRLRNLEVRLNRITFSTRNPTVLELRRDYMVDVWMLDHLVPELDIAIKWGY